MIGSPKCRGNFTNFCSFLYCILNITSKFLNTVRLDDVVNGSIVSSVFNDFQLVQCSRSWKTDYAR